MDTFTVRVEDSTKEELDSEYDDYGFDGRSDYIRHLLEHRHVIMEGAPTEHELADRVDDLEAEFDRFRGAVELFQPAGDPESGTYSLDAAEGATVTETPEPAVASVDDLDIRGQGDVLEARRDALAAVYERLQELGEATKQELLEPVDADAVGYQSADSFWTNCIAGAGTLSRLPGVESPPDGGRTWRYEG